MPEVTVKGKLACPVCGNAFAIRFEKRPDGTYECKECGTICKRQEAPAVPPKKK